MIRRFSRFPKIASLVFFLFTVSQFLPFHYSLVFAEAITGSIQKISQLEDGRFVLSIKSDSGVSEFIVDEFTQVQTELSAKDVKKGQRIVIPSQQAVKGVKGLKTPFGNMSASAKKTLGLPNIPNIPEIPKVPKIPEIPKLPPLPGKSAPAKAAGTEQGTAPAPQGEMAPPPMGEEDQEKQEEEIPDLPQGPSVSELMPNPLSSPIVEPESSGVPKTVLQSKPTHEGIEIKLADESGEENITLSPEEKVFQILSVQDLKKKMNVSLEISEDPSGTVVQKITVV